jgi:hypothetical protein
VTSKNIYLTKPIIIKFTMNILSVSFHVPFSLLSTRLQALLLIEDKPTAEQAIVFILDIRKQISLQKVDMG